MLKRKLMTALCAMSVTFVGAGCGDDEPTNPNPPPAQTYSVGGTVSGLAGSGLVLSAGTNNVVNVSANGAFTLPTKLATGTAYAVTVQTQPSSPSQTCAVTNGTGTVGSANVTNVQVTCTTNSYTVGGTVTGLAGTGLTLQNNGGDDLTVDADGAFTFATSVASGEDFEVTVSAQPGSPTQTCTVSGGTGTVGAGNVTTVTVNCATNTYTVGGTVSGLVGEVTLALAAGGDPITAVLTAEGTFAFATAVASGTGYTVSVQTQPANQTCTVTNGTGTVASANVTNVAVTCTTNGATTFTVGGTVTGLAGTLVLQNNGGDDLSVTANGPFTFTTPVAAGGAYAVTVLTQPAGLTCSVADGSGNVAGANVSNVAVSCIPNAMVLRVGDGSAPPTGGTSVAISLQEFEVGATAAKRSIAIDPATVSITHNGTSEGALVRSVNGRLVTFAGYRVPAGTAAVTGTTANAVRTAVAVDAGGTVTLVDMPGAFLTNTVRGAVTVDGSAYWMSGNGSTTTGGVWYTPAAAGSTPLRIATVPNNARWVGIFGDQLYLSSGSTAGAGIGVLTVGTGLPTTEGQSTALVANAGTFNSPYGYAFVDTDSAVAGPEVLYIAYDNPPTADLTVHVQKFVNVAGTWTLQTAFVPADTAKVGARGLAAARLENGTTLVYAVTTDNRLVSFIDDGGNTPAVTTVATAETNINFRGVAIAPVAPVAP